MVGHTTNLLPSQNCTFLAGAASLWRSLMSCFFLPQLYRFIWIASTSFVSFGFCFVRRLFLSAYFFLSCSSWKKPSSRLQRNLCVRTAGTLLFFIYYKTIAFFPFNSRQTAQPPGKRSSNLAHLKSSRVFKCRVCKTHTCEARRPSRCPPTSALQPGEQLTEPRRLAAPRLSSAAGNPKNPLGSSDPPHCCFNPDKNKAERTKQTCGCRHGVWIEINLPATYGLDYICLKSILASLCLDVYRALPTVQPHPSSALRTDGNVDGHQP